MEPARLMEVYRECMRSHACDGCCKYTPDALRPHMLFCTACGCHRNFHRRVVVLSTNAVANIDRMLMDADPFGPRERRRTRL